MFERIVEIITEQLNVEADAVKMETDFKADLGADSLDLFELVNTLEDEYGVEIDADELENLTTVKAVMEYLKGKGIN